MLKDDTVNKEYAPIAGDGRYVELALRFAYGNEMDLGSVAGVQSLSGTGACRIGEWLRLVVFLCCFSCDLFGDE